MPSAWAVRSNSGEASVSSRIRSTPSAPSRVASSSSLSTAADDHCAGVPVVAPDHGAFPELLDGEGAGLLHAAGSSEALARALAAVLDDGNLASRLGAHGHALARERHSDAAMAEAHEQVYAERRSP